jgi:peptidoglycan/xylan/chitin deacetylase (PgdA/CDA1 family)
MRPPPLALVYHGIGDVSLRGDEHRVFVRLSDLERHVRRLRQWGYDLMPFSAWARRVFESDARGCAAVTFDDGFVDNLALLKLGLPATVFVVSRWLGRPHPYAPRARLMNADELRTLHAAGVEVAAHTRSHASLAQADYASAFAELSGSRRDLETLLDAEVTTAAYPFGRASSEARRACRDAGFLAAAGADGHGRWDDAFHLPRQDMGNRSTDLGLFLKAHDRYHLIMGTWPGRAARRARLYALGQPVRGWRAGRDDRHRSSEQHEVDGPSPIP